MEENQNKPFFKRRTARALLFTGALGWTSFILTVQLWESSMTEYNGVLESHQQSHADQQQELRDRDKQIATQHSLTQAEKLVVVEKEKDIANLNHAISKLTSDHEAALAAEKQKTAKEKQTLAELLQTIHQKYRDQPPSAATLKAWADLVSQHPFPIAKLNDATQFEIALRYFSLGMYPETKQHLKLSNHFNPKREKELLASLDLNSSINAVATAIEEKLGKEQIQPLLENAHRLLKPLSTQPENKEQYRKLMAQLLSLETQLVLSAPPKEALDSLQKLVLTLEPIATKEGSTLSQRLHFLDAATNAFSLAAALGQQHQLKQLELSISSACEWVEKADPKESAIGHSKCVVLLHTLDSLFLEGDPREITKVANKLEEAASMASPQSKVIFEAAAAGHKASLLFEKGEVTKGRDILNEATGKLNKLCKDSPDNTLAQFRLGILYWLQGQLTTSDDVVFKALNHSITTLEPVLKKAPVTETRQARQFAAMVEGDLGHLVDKLGKKDEAKQHFSNALIHWKYIVTHWGATEETKEGVDYCQWRINQL